MVCKILLVSAMEQELKPIEEACLRVLPEDERHTRNTLSTLLTGVGKVNAATAISRFLMERRNLMVPGVRIIIVGLAGAIDPELKVGDIVISQDALQHDMDVTALTDLGLKKGQIPFEDESIWPANEKLVELASKIAEAGQANVVCGRILTGDQFIADPDKKRELFAEFGGACADMETAAIAQVCDLLWSRSQVPRWISLRVISDTADHQAPEDFNQSLKNGMNKLAAIVAELIKQL